MSRKSPKDWDPYDSNNGAPPSKKLKTTHVEKVSTYDKPLSLIEAARLGDIERVKYLVNVKGESVNSLYYSENDSGVIASKMSQIYTLTSRVMHIACFFGQKDVAEFLAFMGADIEVKNNLGLNPIELLTRSPHVKDARDVEEAIIRGKNDRKKLMNGGVEKIISYFEREAKIAPIEDIERLIKKFVNTDKPEVDKSCIVM